MIRQRLLHPARIVAFAFLVAILIGTALLMMPFAREGGGSVPFLTALFTATSAVCVTGLAIVDTGTYWSSAGQATIMLLFQIGGFGMMTGATLLGLMVNRSPRLRLKLITQTETHTLGLGDVANVAKLVLTVTIVCEFIVALVLTLRFRLGYGLEWQQAAWSGLFHSVSAFNNAGFSIHADSVMRYAPDALVLLPLMLAIFIGGIGFPVLMDLRDKTRSPRSWSLHTKLTLAVTGFLLALGFLGILIFEWHNAKTLGAMALPEKILSAAFTSVSARTAGFNTIDLAVASRETWSLHYLLMFVGAGSAGTAGGVKVGTVAILFLLVLAEIRGHPDSEAFGRRVGGAAQRQAVTVLVLGSATVILGTTILLSVSDATTDRVIFEVISAFGTVGLSTGITADLPAAGQFVLVALMYLGRIGTITLATSLILGERRMPYRYPEEHPIVG
ncbi:potassium transporter TrkG [Massilia sp. CCM 9210]|uniref:TrkH family potassium uptake protein n=1 Tax=Massilia scottii TaxID=3057166 RepID=UPI002796A33D|nr:potassium transporter TrkG [Massilia sp. CCM 9210]MDQ1812051.1 potassium transporter TrkG [Massilia sp. CCM 9210]